MTRSPATSNASLLPAVQAARLAFVLSGQPLAQVVSVLIAAMTAVMLRSAAPRELLWTWVIVLAVVNTLRLWHCRRYRSYQARGALDASRYERQFEIGCLAAGTVWGSSALFFLPGNSALQFFLAFAIGGVTSGALSTLSVAPRAASAFVLPCVLPLTVRFLMANDAMHEAMGAMTAVYTVAVTMVAWRGQRQLTQMVSSQLDAQTNREALKVSEASLQQSEADLHRALTLKRAILDSANYGIVSTTADGIVVTYNATAERLLGYAASEVIGKVTPGIWHDHDEIVRRAAALSNELGCTVHPGFEAFVAKARLGQADENEWTLIRKDGARFPGSLSASRLTDGDGNVVGYLGVLGDITDRKLQEAQLRLSEERFRSAFDDAPIGMALVRTDGQILRVNRALCAMLGYSEDQLLSTTLRTLTFAEDQDSDALLMTATLEGTTPSYKVEKRYLKRTGEVIFASLGVSLIRDREGRPLHFVIQLEDVTHRHEMDRLKSEFVSTVSHELRTPLTSIRGALGLLDGGALGQIPSEAVPMVKVALQNCERLGRIIDDILDIQKIESGRLKLQIERVYAPDILAQAVAANRSYADKYRVGFALQSVPDASMWTDRDRFQQVMANLLSNAAKFSPAGSVVTIRARTQGPEILIEVEDHGTGIPEEFRGRIFDRFAQADSSAARRFDGTGLGLSITKQLVEMMGGRIQFATSIGHGTTFSFNLPAAGAAAHDRSVAAALI